MNVTAFNFGFYNYNINGQLSDSSLMDYSDDDDDGDATTTTEAPNFFTSTPKCQWSNGQKQIDLSHQMQSRPTTITTNDDFIQRRIIDDQHDISTGNDLNDKTMNLLSSPPSTSQIGQVGKLFCETQKLWSNELREKAIQMAKLNSASNDAESIKVTRNQMEMKFLQRLESNSPSNTLQCDEEGSCTAEAATSTSSYGIQQRINFFNDLTKATHEIQRSSNKFLTMLKSSRNMPAATIKTATTTARTATLEEMKKHQKINGDTGEAMQQRQTQPLRARFASVFTAKVFESRPESNLMASNHPEVANNEATTMRKTTTATTTTATATIHRNKTSLEKARCSTVMKPNANTISGTKPHMHTMMDDLSLVMPVRFRIAEYERQMKFQK